ILMADSRDTSIDIMRERMARYQSIRDSSKEVPGHLVEATIPVEGGIKLTGNDILDLYDGEGLRSTFIRTDVTNIGENVSSLNPMRNPVTRKLAEGHRKLREGGEFAEDIPRVGHFIHALQNPPKSAK